MLIVMSWTANLVDFMALMTHFCSLMSLYSGGSVMEAQLQMLRPAVMMKIQPLTLMLMILLLLLPLPSNFYHYSLSRSTEIQLFMHLPFVMFLSFQVNSYASGGFNFRLKFYLRALVKLGN